MYAAITNLKLLPGNTENAAELFASLVMPGYAEGVSRGAWVFTNAEDNRAMAVVLYETREAAEAREEKKAFEQAIEANCIMLAEPPRRDVFFVAMGTMAGAPAPARICEPSLPPLSGDIMSLLAEVSRAL